jgi:uncharacterized repeat protein (TIGR03803 family)
MARWRSNLTLLLPVFLAASGMAIGLAIAPASSHENTLHAFQGGSDGALPNGGLIDGKNGNFYGTTVDGGSNSGCQGCGVIFKIAPDGAETVLYSFQGGNDGAGPSGSLLKDKAGNLFGTTLGGGNACSLSGGCGTVFKLAPDGTETVLFVESGWYRLTACRTKQNPEYSPASPAISGANARISPDKHA